MKYLTIFFWMFIYLSEGFSTNNLLFYKGDSLFNLELYREASIEFEKVAYRAESNKTLTLALLRKAECKLRENSFAEAENTLSRVRFYDISDTLYIEGMYKYALSCYLNGNLKQCETLLINLTSSIEDTSRVYAAYFLNALCLNEQREYDKAFKSAQIFIKQNKKLDDKSRTQSLESLKNFYSGKTLPKLKNPAKAEKLSTFLPGAGQLYAGYFWEGAVNVFLQLATLSFGGYQIYLKNYLTGSIIGISMAQRFYMGGLSRSAFLAEKTNYRRCKAFNESVKSYLSNIHQ